MLRLYDAGDRRIEEVRPVTSGALRMYVPELPSDREPGVHEVRGFLMCDLIRRTAERHDLRVVTVPGEAPLPDAFRGGLATLNVHLAQPAPPGDRRVDVVIDADVEQRAGQGALDYIAAPHRVRPATVTLGDHVEPTEQPGRARPAESTGTVVPLSDLESRGLDPLALRLALLQTHYRKRAELTRDELRAADATLRRLRTRVAEWAESPSKAMCAEYVRRAADAFDDDLDTATALAALRDLEADSELPPGAKFETAAYLDRLVAVDLARDIGKPRPKR